MTFLDLETPPDPLAAARALKLEPGCNYLIILPAATAWEQAARAAADLNRAYLGRDIRFMVASDRATVHEARAALAGLAGQGEEEVARWPTSDATPSSGSDSG